MMTSNRAYEEQQLQQLVKLPLIPQPHKYVSAKKMANTAVHGLISWEVIEPPALQASPIMKAPTLQEGSRHSDCTCNEVL